MRSGLLDMAAYAKCGDRWLHKKPLGLGGAGG